MVVQRVGNVVMRCSRQFSIYLAVTWLLVGTTSAAGWEVELKSDVTMQRAVVRLGDIAVISGLSDEDAEPLQQIIVAPGPTRAYSRSLSTSQLYKVLVQRGVDMAQCRFRGAQRVVVVYDQRPELHAAVPDGAGQGEDLSGEATSYDQALPPASRAVHYRAANGMAMVHGIEDALAEQVNTHLMKLSGDEVPWDVTVQITPRALQDLPTDWSAVAVEGVENAVEGAHQLVAHFTSSKGDVRLPVEATAARKIELVVATKPLRRGDVIGAGDVELRYTGTTKLDPLQVATRLEDVVGRLVQYPIRAEEPLRTSALKKPVLIKRREEVTVVARRGAIKITTRAVALDEGCLGDVISLERQDEGKKKERFVARVVGVQEAEVFVSNASVNVLGSY